MVPFQANVPEVLEFLQSRLNLGQTFSTVKVCLAAISACHVGFEGETMGQQPLVWRFMKDAMRLQKVSKPLFPSWGLAVVLDALCRQPFEPLGAVELKFPCLKTVLIVALTTSKRVSDIQALSVGPECMRFAAGDKVMLKPNAAFVPKNLQVVHTPAELVAFHPPPFASVEDERLNYLCPFRALRWYCQRTAAGRNTSLLFVSYGPGSNRTAVAGSTVSRWIVEAIRLAYASRSVRVPEGLRAHSTRGVSASWALSRGLRPGDLHGSELVVFFDFRGFLQPRRGSVCSGACCFGCG